MSDDLHEQAVFEAARRGKLDDLLDALHPNGGRVNPDGYLTYDGSSALHISVMGSFAACAKCLVDAGADITLEKEDLSNVFHLSCSGARKKDAPAGADGYSSAALTARELIRHMEAAGRAAESRRMADARNEDSLTPIHLAAYYNDLGLCKVLVEEGGADVGKIGEDGTALDMTGAGDTGGDTGPLRAYLIEKMKAAGIEDPEKHGAACGKDVPQATRITERFGYGAFDREEVPWEQKEANVAGPDQEGKAEQASPPTGCVRGPLAPSSRTPTCAYCFSGVSSVLRSAVAGPKQPAVVARRSRIPDTTASAHGTETVRRLFWQGFEDRQGVDLEEKLQRTEMIFGRRLFLSPMGFGSHYCTGSLQEEDEGNLVQAITKLGVNVIDTAVNYGDGEAEKMIGRALQISLSRTVEKGTDAIGRESVFVISKVGNVVGEANVRRCRKSAVAARVSDTSSVPRTNTFSTLLSQRPEAAVTFHCLDPAWIKQEVSASLERLQLEKLDCVLLHNPETFLYLVGGFENEKSAADCLALKFTSNSSDDIGKQAEAELTNFLRATHGSSRSALENAFYREVIFHAFVALEELRREDKIAYYGVSGAFYPLRPSEPQHLLFLRLVEEAEKALVHVRKTRSTPHGMRVVQTPLNFSETGCVSLEQIRRNREGGVLRNADRSLDPAYNADKTLIELCTQHNVYLMTNRPLTGVLGEMPGVLRFTSERLPMNSAMQGEDVDQLELKLTKWLDIGAVEDGGAKQGAEQDEEDFFARAIAGQLSGKTMLVLATLASKTPATILCGCFRKQEYISDVFSVIANNNIRIKRTGPLAEDSDSTTVRQALAAMKSSLTMWYQMAQDVQEDHGTAKDWRLPVKDAGPKANL